MQKQTTIPVFIGYDEREHIPYLVTQYTTLEKTPSAKCYPLNHRDLRKMDLFTRSWSLSPIGQYFDDKDNKPFATQFSHSRFLTPLLSKIFSKTHNKYAIFYDCDFVVLEDLQYAIAECEALGGDKAVYVVPHKYNPQSTKKMDNMEQTQYNCKLWSAFMIFNTEHPDCSKLTPELVSSETGAYLHQFKWTKEIGYLSERWQFIPNHSEENEEATPPSTIHWTEGGPWFPHMYLTSPYRDLWLGACEDMLESYKETPEHLLFSGSLEYALEKDKNA